MLTTSNTCFQTYMILYYVHAIYKTLPNKSCGSAISEIWAQNYLCAACWCTAPDTHRKPQTNYFAS